MEPIFFVSFFEEKQWGGQKLSSLYGKYPAGINIGESWEFSSVLYRQTFVRDGIYAGTMLSDLYKREQAHLFGTETPYVPFVIKLIDARKRIPVLVHGGGLKNDDTQVEGAYIIKIENEHRMVAGTSLKNGLELFGAIAENTLENHLNYLEIQEGDALLVPPGVFHCFGDDMLIYTITTPLIETASVFDWGRYSELKIDKVADSFHYDDTLRTSKPEVIDEFRKVLLQNSCFKLLYIDARSPLPERTDAVFCAYTSLSPGRIDYNGKSKNFRAGETFLIPAHFDEYTISGGSLLKAIPA
ncbi:MAG: hypothetical protein LBN36_08370 [Clostridiales Family XIII bacterium]|jgi:mannose-6-phosphate isomerase|nr:hypothetical protein [Clostridiales Family XIII bacterium]